MKHISKIISVIIILCFILNLNVLTGTVMAESGTLAGEEPAAGAPEAPDRLIVHFKPGVSAEAMQQVLKKIGASVEKDLWQINARVVAVPPVRAAAGRQTYTEFSEIDFVEPDFTATASENPNDSKFKQQWGLIKIQAPEAWALTHGSDSIKIAVLDTGIDSGHADLAAKIAVKKNFSSSDTTEDRYGHGTHVAGIASAVTDNETGIAGIGYNTGLMNVKVLNDDGSGSYSAIAEGIIWAADNGADIINLSLEGNSPSSTLERAVDYAWDKGAVVVAAAGNSGTTGPTYPASYENVIAVAATDDSDHLCSFSNRGNWVDVAAPGSSISTLPGNKYGNMSGTSMASPLVAGLAGLVMSLAQDVDNDGKLNGEVRRIIQSSCDDIGDSNIGSGRINAYKAVSAVEPAPAPEPGPDPDTGEKSFGLDRGDRTFSGTSQMNLQRFRNTAGSGTLSRLEVLVDDVSPSGKIRFGVYADNNGTPGSLLLDAGEAQVVNGWTGISGLNLPVTADTIYWLAFLPQTGTDIRYQSTGMPGNCHTNRSSSYGSLPAVYGSGEMNSTPYVMRAVVIPAQSDPDPVSGTFGLDSGDFSYTKTAGYLDLMRFRNTAGNGTLSKLELLVDEAAPEGEIRFAVYADNNGRPGGLLLDAGASAMSSGRVSVSGLNLPVTQDEYYWLGFSLSANNHLRSQSNQPAGSHYFTRLREYGAFPEVYPTIGFGINSNQYVMHATVAR